MKNNLYCILLGLSLLSCKKYLDVQPQDRFLSKQVFSSEASVNSALNGIYINMAKSSLYGSRLSMRDLDIMAQYYKTTQNPGVNLISSYNYTDQSTLDSFGEIWQAAYRVILNSNSFIQQLGQTQGVMDPGRKDILMGEAYAIRAYMHFDLLRLFGPVYSTDSLKMAMPYLTAPTDQIQSILPANMVMDSVLKDLKRASLLLANDPIRKVGVKVQSGTDPLNDFYAMRNRRFNYYAVLGIKARVLLYRKDKPGALMAAKTVITEANTFFPWSPGSSSMPNTGNPDRNFSSEIILGFQNVDMYNQQRDFFNATLFDYQILAPIPQRLDEIFNNFLNDYRYRVNWRDGGSAGKTYKTFVKYEDVTGQKLPFRNFQSLLRLSELYYIAAESEPDKTIAIGYLNTVRNNRGLPNVNPTVNLIGELTKEYRKEFWGEGQTFYYFKRQAAASIPSGNTNGSSVGMDVLRYVVPLPLIETQNR